MKRAIDEPIFQVWDEAMELWKCGGCLWLDYISALPMAWTPAALMEANAKLAAGSLNLAGFAAGQRLYDNSWTAPTLNDA